MVSNILAGILLGIGIIYFFVCLISVSTFFIQKGPTFLDVVIWRGTRLLSFPIYM